MISGEGKAREKGMICTCDGGKESGNVGLLDVLCG